MATRKPAAPKPEPAPADAVTAPKAVKAKAAKPAAKVAKAAKVEEAAAVVPEPAAPAPEPEAKAPRKPAPRKAKAAAEAPAPEPEAAPAPPPAPVVHAPGLDPQAQAVLDAIRAGAALEFIFENADANPPRTFEPRSLAYDALSQAWYAWGWDRRYNAERHHRLDLLKEINPVEGLGRAAQGPFKDGTPANLIGGWLGGEPIAVKAVLMKQWTFAVKQAPPAFPEFRMEDAEEGKAQVSFTATDLRAIARWCMQFGDGIQVLEPQRLVDRIKQVGVAWGGKPVRSEPEPARPAARPDRPRRDAEDRPRREAEDRPRRDAEDRPRREAEDRPRRDAEEKPKGGKPAKVEVRIERL